MSAFRKGQHIMIKDRPCKIIEMSTSKTGKHGSAKVHLFAVDIFNGKKVEDVCPSTANKDKPIVTRVEYMLLDISSDGYVSLMKDNGDTKEDVKIPEGELGTDIRNRFDNGDDCMVTIMAACGEEQIVMVKTNTSK